MTAAETTSSITVGEPEPGPEGSRVDRGAQESLAAVLDPTAFRRRIDGQWSRLGWDDELCRHSALVMAERALAAGYRLVLEDPS